jgi:hypothetical protein
LAAGVIPTGSTYGSYVLSIGGFQLSLSPCRLTERPAAEANAETQPLQSALHRGSWGALFCNKGSSLACVHPTKRRSARAQNKVKDSKIRWPPPQDTQTPSRPIMGEDGPSDSALAAARGWRLRRAAADRHAARCASREIA